MPILADAPFASIAPIRRSDYTPPAFLVDSVELEFDLDPAATTVTNRMRIRRNTTLDMRTQKADLYLNGEALELVNLTLNGMPWKKSQLSETALTVKDVPDTFELTIVNRCRPAENTALMGLYVSNGQFFTQCEAQGFRRITYFPDRPDVMTRYTVKLRADKNAYPVLLSNGNLIATGDLPDGRHYAHWQDPFAKPCYLFALVAGQLVALEECIVTASSAQKLLQIWVEERDLDKTRYAMDALIHAIRWDETRFGLELDLERFMIVAVADFNSGAMENKGLNLFNTKYIFAHPDTATDADYAHVEAVIGHEYFHNWTGNRVTCRDWFQLSLKEGLTVFREQEFSTDRAAAGYSGVAAETIRALKRIEDVRLLRQMQFPEDAGPMAHPVRPESYLEINNFYTATVYEKGAEIVRMLQTLLGRDGFRSGLDLYFKRHDGQAVTCDDFWRAIADANQRDLTQFERWYRQAGTPRVKARMDYDPDARMCTLTLTQYNSRAAALSGQTSAEPLLIPFALGLMGADGCDIPLQLDGETAPQGTTRILELSAAEQSFRFVQIAEKPTPSLLRNFSAPVVVEYAASDDELVFLLTHDRDPFNRWEAGQRLMTRALLTYAHARSSGASADFGNAGCAALRALGHVLRDTTLAPAYRTQVLTAPSIAELIEQMERADPAAAHAARRAFRIQLAHACADDWRTAYEQHHTPGVYRPTPADAGRRALKNLALGFLCDIEDEDNEAAAMQAHQLAHTQYENANNLTDRRAALAALIQLGGAPAQAALADFYQRFEHEPLAIDTWFALQALNSGDHGDQPVLETVQALRHHPAFTLSNPNRVRALIFSFCIGNPAQFHAADGAGYAFWIEQVLALDAHNPYLAARLARALERWRAFIPTLQTPMHAALLEVQRTARSPNVREIVDAALNDKS